MKTWLLFLILLAPVASCDHLRSIDANLVALTQKDK